MASLTLTLSFVGWFWLLRTFKFPVQHVRADNRATRCPTIRVRVTCLVGATVTTMRGVNVRTIR